MTNLYALVSTNNGSNKVLYIGKTENLTTRLNGHNHLPNECYARTNKIMYFTAPTAVDADILETLLINHFKPEYNTQQKYGVAPQWFDVYGVLGRIKWEDWKHGKFVVNPITGKAKYERFLQDTLKTQRKFIVKCSAGRGRPMVKTIIIDAVGITRTDAQAMAEAQAFSMFQKVFQMRGDKTKITVTKA